MLSVLQCALASAPVSNPDLPYFSTHTHPLALSMISGNSDGLQQQPYRVTCRPIRLYFISPLDYCFI